MADILFVHNNFPAQFRFLAETLPARGHRCAAVASATGKKVGSVPVARWNPGRGTTPGIFEPATRAEADLIRGKAAAEAAGRLRAQGFDPALIIAHPGWGETIFLREIFPRARQILYGEFYYRGTGADVGFDPEFEPPSLAERFRVHAKNATGALAYLDADRIVSPTAFQASVFPPDLGAKIRVIHDGIDTDRLVPRPAMPVQLASGAVLDPARPIVTFVNRRFEPLRGFHTFMRALPAVLDAVPEAEIVLVGSDDNRGYGASAGTGTTWKARLLAEIGPRLDPARLHWTGPVAHPHLMDLLGLGVAHVYLTYPFALSWSLLDAMSIGCAVLGSRTPPVEEVIVDGRNGHLVDMFDPAALAATLIEACRRDRAETADMRDAARRTVVERFDRVRVTEPRWLALVDETLALGPVPPGRGTSS